MDKFFHHLKREIEQVAIQGASNVAHETLRTFAEYCETRQPCTKRDWNELRNTGHAVARIRPTEPLARNMVQLFLANLAALSKRSSVEWKQLVARELQELVYAHQQAEAALVRNGSKLIRARSTIFTHCHSSLAERILITAHRSGKRFGVYHTETRPLFQGHTTHTHLRSAKVSATLVADSAAAYLVSNSSGDDVKVDMVLFGADSVSKDGTVMNKVGSFGIALAAFDSGIPVYVACPLLKLDVTDESTAELRSERELWPGAPRSARIVNYAFDSIPPKYLRGIITEQGVCRPRQFAAQARKKYPQLTSR